MRIPKLTERQRATIGPRDSKPEGSLEWCWQTLDLLKTRWERKDLTIMYWRETIEDLRRVQAWTAVPPGFSSLDELLLAEIGKTENDGEQVLFGQHGGDRKSEQSKHQRENQGNNVTLIERGNKADYLTARLARDRPDILERMKAGEFKSVHAAAVEAGIVKKPSDLKKLQLAWRRATPDERDTFLNWINEGAE